MVNKLLIGACLALSLAACASAPTTTDSKAQPALAQDEAPLGCVNGTGTRLKVSPTDCTEIGMTHSKTAVDATGRPYLQQSLQMIDPTVHIGGVAAQ